MTIDKVFLSCHDNGVTRAESDTNENWSVEQLATDLMVTCLAADPSNADVVYAGTREKGVWCSEDRGLTWKPRGMEGHMIKSLAVSPHDSDVIYAGTKPALMFVSKDGGKIWGELESFRRIPNRWWWFSPAEPPDRRAYVIAIGLSPTDPEVLLAGIEFGAVVRSEDGGKTWSRHRGGALRDCHSLKFHHSEGNWAYEAGGTGGGASFSRDGGRSFQKAKRGLAKNYGIVCAADPGKPEIWYVCVGPSPFSTYGDSPEIYLYRSTGGAGWQPIGWSSHPLSETPTALVTLKEAPGHLYAGLRSGDVWHSVDYGDTWTKMPFNLKGIWSTMLVI